VIANKLAISFGLMTDKCDMRWCSIGHEPFTALEHWKASGKAPVAVVGGVQLKRGQLEYSL